ncbi:MAG: hypothetical protein R3293_20870 [Candidatus Promineifilaceae bacterium]|nr:hypothetical protein [Candidatus Promineifilaceae bacterium]
MAESISYDIISFPENEPIVLTGPPRKLTGRVLLHNPGNANVVVRDAGLKDAKGVLPSRPSRYTLPKFVLRPEQGRNVNLKIALDDNTPPGEYQVELDVVGRLLPAVLHVSEVFDLEIEPRRIVLAGKAKQAQKKRLIISNKGNVAIAIGDLGPVDLKDDIIWDRALRLAFEPLADKADLDFEELVVTVLRVAREESSTDNSLLVSNLSGKTKIAPGETAAIDLEISLQEPLPPNSRYRGLLPILDRDLDIIVVSSIDTEDEEPVKRTARKTTRAAKTTSTTRKRTTRTRKPRVDEEAADE